LVGKSNSAVAELAAVKEADRAVKAATKGKGKGANANPVRAAKAAARKSSAKVARRR